MSGISTHILNTSTGKPAAGVSISLYFLKDSSWNYIAEGITDKDGRIANLLAEIKVREKGIYKLIFLTGNYFKDAGIRNFYPYVEIIFEIDSDDHYHIPLLLSPFGYSTYRGC
jgi:5-hydroxyisourate hydrolase